MNSAPSSRTAILKAFQDRVLRFAVAMVVAGSRGDVFASDPDVDMVCAIASIAQGPDERVCFPPSRTDGDGAQDQAESFSTR